MHLSAPATRVRRLQPRRSSESTRGEKQRERSWIGLRSRGDERALDSISLFASIEQAQRIGEHPLILGKRVQCCRALQRGHRFGRALLSQQQPSTGQECCGVVGLIFERRADRFVGAIEATALELEPGKSGGPKPPSPDRADLQPGSPARSTQSRHRDRL